MKRYLAAILLVPIVLLTIGVTIDAQGPSAKTSRKTGKKGDGTKAAIECRAAVTGPEGSIVDCPSRGAAEVSIPISINKRTSQKTMMRLLTKTSAT